MLTGSGIAMSMSVIASSETAAGCSLALHCMRVEVALKRCVSHRRPYRHGPLQRSDWLQHSRLRSDSGMRIVMRTMPLVIVTVPRVAKDFRKAPYHKEHHDYSE